MVKSAAKPKPEPEPEPSGDDGGDDIQPSRYAVRQVADLKDELRRRGLPVSGNKAALIARLEENE